MNKKGFTLIELLATLIILGIVVSLTIVGVNSSLNKAREKTEEVFVNTIHDSLKIYIDSDAKRLSFSTDSVCTVSKSYGTVMVYQATNNLTFDDVINSTYRPILKSELVNPANKDKSNYQCNSNGGPLQIYRDDDYVYYYKISKSSFECLNSDDGYITNLPSECL